MSKRNIKVVFEGVRKKIYEYDGNMIVNASAGTGKTFLLTHKIVKDLDNNKGSVAAITFTIKAAKEISSRVKVARGDNYFGTTNGFAIEEIIRPFIVDVYGKECEKDINIDYREDKIETFFEGIKNIKNKSKICSYSDNKKNFIFELALDILKKSKAARRYIKCKYFKLYIDEYQDSDEYMDNFFQYIRKELKITLFIVGDSKQAIYGFRGSNSIIFNNLISLEDYKVYEMHDSFRCSLNIQNYANLILPENRSLYKKDDSSKLPRVIQYKKFPLKEKEIFNIKQGTIAVLVRTNKKAEEICEAINDRNLSNQTFVCIPSTPFDDIGKESIWPCIEILKFMINNDYSEYDFHDEMEFEFNIKIIKKKLESFNFVDSIEILQLKIKSIYDILGMDYECVFAEAMHKILNNKMFHTAFRSNYPKNVVLTMHSSKGMEFDKVILRSSDYGYNDSLEDRRLHYVASTRAKSELIILAKDNCNTNIDYNNRDTRKYFEVVREMLNSTGIPFQELVDYIKY